MERLTKEHNLAQQYLDIAGVMIVALDSCGNITSINRKGCKILGYGEDELIGRNWFTTCLPESLRDEIHFVFEGLMAGGIDPVDYEYYENPVLTKAGAERFIAFHNTALTDLESGVVGILFSGEDITERKQAENALRESKYFIEKIINSIRLPIFVKDSRHGFVMVNDAQCELAGVKREEMIGKTDYDFFPKEQVDVFWEIDEIVLSTGEENVSEEKITDSSGVVHTIVTNKALYEDLAGNKFIVGILSDFTERKRAEETLIETRQQLANIIDFLPDATFVINDNGEVIAWNKATVKMTGIEAPAMLGKGNYEYALPFYGERIPILIDFALDPREEIAARYAGLEKRQAGVIGEVYVPALRGRGAYLFGTASILLDSNGNTVGAIESIRDITERRLVEEALKASEERLRHLVGSSEEWVWEVDRNGVYTYASPRVREVLGYCPEDLIGKRSFDLMPAGEASRVEQLFASYRARQEPFSRLENSNFHKDGHLVVLETNGVPFFDGKGNLLGYRGMDRDITLRKKTENELREANAYLENIFESSPDGIGIVDKDGKPIKWNRAAVEQFGYSLEELGSKSVYDLYADKTELDRMLAELHREGKVTEYAINMKKKDGAIAAFDLSISLLKDDANRTIGSICLARDMSKTKEALSDLAASYHRLTREIADRRRAQDESAASEIRYRRLFEAAKDGILIMDPVTGKILDANPFVLDLLGDTKEKVLGKYLWDIGSFKDVETSMKIFKELQENEYVRYENLPLQNQEGKTVDVEFVSNVYEVDHKKVIQCNIRDITERKEAERTRIKLEAQLTQAHKLEAIGTLAGGIAHDFNNILGIMFGYTEMALFEAPPSSHLRENLEQVMTAGNRAKELVKQILIFSRQAHANQERQPLQIRLIAKEALKMLRATLPTTITIRSDIQGEGIILADPAQAHQVFMNLCTNAAQAMREEGGTLAVTLRDIDLDEPMPHLDLSPGKYVKLSVSDTGPGMTPEVCGRIFEPFYTTKGLGEGTGMGLSIVYGIVRDNQGAITVYSEPGQGTIFNVFLPGIEDMPLFQPRVPVENLCGKGRILCVDDEPSMLNIVRKMLEKLGYEVESRSNGIEAIKAFEANPDGYDLVITDQTMPQMTGAKLARELLCLRPEIPIILCTGFSELMTPGKAREMGIKAMLMKPLTLSELGQTVRNVLDEKRSNM